VGDVSVKVSYRVPRRWPHKPLRGSGSHRTLCVARISWNGRYTRVCLSVRRERKRERTSSVTTPPMLLMNCSGQSEETNPVSDRRTSQPQGDREDENRKNNPLKDTSATRYRVSVFHDASVASLVLGIARDQVLLRKGYQFPGVEEVHALDGSGGRKRLISSH